MVNVKITHFDNMNKVGGLFEYKGQWYWADIVELRYWADIVELQYWRDLCDTPYEFMVFKSDEQGKITDWSGEFVIRLDVVSDEILLHCIEEFMTNISQSQS